MALVLFDYFLYGTISIVFMIIVFKFFMIGIDFIKGLITKITR